MPASYDKLAAHAQCKIERVRQNDRNRHYSVWEISGPAWAVMIEVSERLLRDSHTQCYEHMKLRVAEVTTLSDNHITVKLTKNNYAGD